MISVTQALDRISQMEFPTPEWHLLPLAQAGGMVLAEDIDAPADLPGFDHSAMDGYAVHPYPGERYKVIGEVKAGDTVTPELRPGEAVRIFTGAPLPQTARSVCMQEQVRVDADGIIPDSTPVEGNHIRRRGEQILKGQRALPKGSVLTAATIGYLSALGITEVKVCKLPRVAVVVTGNELIPSGQALLHGQIHDSNSPMLCQALKENGISQTAVYRVKDEAQSLLELLGSLMNTYELVLISGGISVGDHDHVKWAMDTLKVREIFYKVNQKPGKPLFLGQGPKTIFFGLPGNPASSLCCFYVYVIPVLHRFLGRSSSQSWLYSPIKEDYQNNSGKELFLRAVANTDGVSVLEGQGSGMLHSFSAANAIIRLPASPDHFPKGSLVSTLLINP